MRSDILNSRTVASSKKSDDWRTDAKAFAESVDRAMRQAAERAITEHHRAGFPVTISRNGRLGRLYPDGTFRPLDEAPPE